MIPQVALEEDLGSPRTMETKVLTRGWLGRSLRQDEADGQPIAAGEPLVGNRAGELAHQEDAAASGPKKILWLWIDQFFNMLRLQRIEGRSLILDGEDEFVRVRRVQSTVNV